MQQKLKTWLALAGLGLVALPAAILVPGCGGGNNSSGISSNAYANHYNGSVTLPANQTGTLSLDVRTDSTASGTFTVNSAAGTLVGEAKVAPRTVLGTASVSGSADNNGGAFQVTGSLTLNGATNNIGITGTLPAPGGSPGTFTVQIGATGAPHTGSITPPAMATPGGTPNATPSATTSGTPSVTPGTTPGTTKTPSATITPSATPSATVRPTPRPTTAPTTAPTPRVTPRVTPKV